MKNSGSAFSTKKNQEIEGKCRCIDTTATPIPRTLHMSLIGIRDMSVLEEAPNDRMPIQTYVMEYNDEMVREAIERECARQGRYTMSITVWKISMR